MMLSSRKTVLKVSLLTVFLLIVSASMMFIFGGNNNTLEDRLAGMNVTTISNVTRNHQTVTAGNALVITGAGRVDANITVNAGGLLVVEGNPGALSGGGVAVDGRIILNGGDFYLLSGGILHNPNRTFPPAMGFVATVVVNNGANFNMLDGVIRGTVATTQNGTFAVDVVNGNFNMDGGTILAYMNGPGVRVTNNGNGRFTMNDGHIRVHNQSPNGEGVRVDGGIFTLNGGEITRTPQMQFTGTGVVVRGGGTNRGNFVMNGGEIHTLGTGVNASGQHANFTMNGGVIHNNLAGVGAGVDLSTGASFVMNDGSITNNRAAQTITTTGGGGVLAVGAGTTFTMNGGIICNNQATRGYGGGVHVRANARFYMYGGYIQYNTAGSGGGVLVLSDDGHHTYMKLDGGTIRENVSNIADLQHDGGGGVAIFAATTSGGFIGQSLATFDMHSGYIIDNRATTNAFGSGMFGVQGGGVAVSGSIQPGRGFARLPTATFNMHGGTISGNTSFCDRTWGFPSDQWTNAGVMGGGVAVRRQGAVFNLHDGIIEENASVGGGGVSVHGAARFDMFGGAIRENEAHGEYRRTGLVYFYGVGNELRGGGGVYLHNTFQNLQVFNQMNSPIFNMHGGSITGNISSDGGGIFWMCSAQAGIIDGINVQVAPPFAPPGSSGHIDFRNHQMRESSLTRVMISADAVIENNIATNGTQVDDELWGRHRAESPTVNWGGNVVTRTVPAPGGGTFEHLFNNHDIRTRQGLTDGPVDPRAHTVTFVASPLGTLNGLNQNVSHTLDYGSAVTSALVPVVEAIWGWEFVGWTYDAQGLNPADPVGHVVEDDINFYAQFQRRYFRATFATDGNGVLVDETFYIDVLFEDVVTLDMMPAVVPNPGFTLSGWTPDPVLGHVMLDHVVFVASFARTHVDLTFIVSPDYAGLVNWDVQHTVSAQVDVPFTAVPELVIIDTDYMFVEWSPFDPMGYTPTAAVGNRTFTAILVPRP